MYSIADFGWMMRDKVRMNAYTQALQRAITPGCAVLDLGAGTGIFSLLACQFGAGKVYAIEPNDSLLLAQTFARANGYSDRIEFFQALSTEVTLKHKADVIIADLRGVLPFNSGSIESMIDARERLLAPGGCIIPQKDTLYAAVYSSAVSYHAIESPWLQNDYGLDLSAGSRFVTDKWKARGEQDLKLLSDAQPWGEIDYRTVSSCNLSGEVSLTVQSAGIAHGISVWFDAELAEGVGFSNIPEAEQLVYGGANFSWPKPVELTQGDQVNLRIETRKMGSEYLWRWNTEIVPFTSANSQSTKFSQSTFNAQLLSPRRLTQSAEDFKPVLNQKGQIEALIFKMMDGKHSLKEIADEVLVQYPQQSTSYDDVLAKVKNLSLRLSD